MNGDGVCERDSHGVTSRLKQRSVCCSVVYRRVKVMCTNEPVVLLSLPPSRLQNVGGGSVNPATSICRNENGVL
jgi:hypothetical protein